MTDNDLEGWIFLFAPLINGRFCFLPPLIIFICQHFILYAIESSCSVDLSMKKKFIASRPGCNKYLNVCGTYLVRVKSKGFSTTARYADNK